MRSCKECMHYKVCTTSLDAPECDFKHKDQYVFMPAYVGQEIWKVYPNRKYNYETKTFTVVGYELEYGRVSMLQQKADKSWKIRITIKGSVGDYTIDEFNKYTYLTEEAAKAELERLKKELANNEL